MTLKEQDQLILRIREYIVRTATVINLTPSFARGRRKSDLLLIKLRGRSEHASIIATNLVDIFPEIDVEVPKGKQQDNYFTLIITQKLANQEAVAEERRAKLIDAIEKGLPVIPQELPDTLEQPSSTHSSI